MINYGHWVTDCKFDPREVLGFVYMITFSNGKKYIGAILGRFLSGDIVQFFNLVLSR